MTFEKPGLDAFVPYGDDRAETARTLVELADKHHISQGDIHAANDGFYISEALADLLYEDPDAADGDADGEADGEDSEQGEPFDAVPYDPIAADRARIREAEEGAIFTQASALATAMLGEERQQEADERVAANEAEAKEAADLKAAIAAASEQADEDDDDLDTQEDTGPNPYEDPTEGDDESDDDETDDDETDDDEAEPIDYSEWEYNALKHEVAERDLDVENQKADTLIAALTEDDAAKADEAEDEDDAAGEDDVEEI